MSVLALIPARSGSKSIPHKNIRIVGGLPLLAHSIHHALVAHGVDRVIVSTDSADYASIALEHGAEVPFVRPANISGDLATDLDVFTHALNWLGEHDGWTPDICVHLRPTHPVRDPRDIDEMLHIIRQDPDLDSVRSVAPAPETPFKMWFRGQDGLLRPIMVDGPHEAWNLPRQALPPVFLQNASIDVVRTAVITEQQSMTGQRIHGYVMEANWDIDNPAQFERAATALGHDKHLSKDTPHRFVFDIDGVVATLVPTLDYELAGPNNEIIDIINFLYAQGHHIILFTARGSMTGRDWFATTERQLREWGVKHHELLMGKPAGDFYVDDRMLSLQNLREWARRRGWTGQ